MTPDSSIPAIDLLRGLVEIPSLSTQEKQASRWLVEQMTVLDYERAYMDAAGNAVGELGDEAAESVVILLGHIDTVPGDIPVRIESVEGQDILYGRGSVDAKGPLAMFVMSAAALGGEWAREAGVRLIVVGAVEEESATSKGARTIRDRFDGRSEPVPVACVIGEPSTWNRVTLGYKGRLLVELFSGQPMAHSAGPDAGIATRAVAFWNWLDAYASEFNAGRERVFDQLQPSLREVHTSVDERMHDTVAAISGIRVPLDFDADAFAGEITDWCAHQLAIEPPDAPTVTPGMKETVHMAGGAGWINLTLRGYEPAWRSPRDTALVRSFLGAIRENGARPGFVVKTGTSDMNVVGPAWQCPILAYGPGDSSLDHTPDEHIVLAEYEKSIEVLADALRNLSLTLR